MFGSASHAQVDWCRGLASAVLHGSGCTAGIEEHGLLGTQHWLWEQAVVLLCLVTWDGSPEPSSLLCGFGAGRQILQLCVCSCM